jgi:hypothetical protein
MKNRETSLDAYDLIKDQTPTLREKVYLYLKGCENGSTDDAAEQALGMKHTTYTARRLELYELGEVVNTGAKGITRSGKSAWIWKAVPKHLAVPPKKKSRSIPKVNPIALPQNAYDLKLGDAQKKLLSKLDAEDSCRCPCCGVQVKK